MGGIFTFITGSQCFTIGKFTFHALFPSREPEIVFPVVRPNVRRSLFRKSIGKAVDFDSMGNKLSQLNAVQSEIDEVKDALSTAEKKCVKRTAKLQKFVNDRNHILNGSIPLNSKPSGYNEKQL